MQDANASAYLVDLSKLWGHQPIMCREKLTTLLLKFIRKCTVCYNNVMSCVLTRLVCGYVLIVCVLRGFHNRCWEGLVEMPLTPPIRIMSP